MRQIRIESQPSPVGPQPCVAIGNFDGVHRGHQALVAAAVAHARERAGTSVVLTFDPHPARVLAPDRAPDVLTSLRQKAELLAGLGVEVMAVLPFDAARARLTPEAFVRGVLVGALGTRHVVVGAGFRFGHRQSGDVAALTALGAEHGFSLQAIAPVLEAGEPISSSRVREALARGEVDAAGALLGRDYAIDGRVVAGDGRGRTIGVPTANLATENEIVPAHGVYAARCRLRDAASAAPGNGLPAVVNVGSRPTFGGQTVTIEAHLLDFSGDLYGRELRLSFVARLRGEVRFPGVEALVAQIRADVARARELLLSGPSAGAV